MNRNKRETRLNILPLLLILFIGIAYTAIGFMIPPVGDDLGFIETFRSQNDCWYAFPRYVYRAWLWNNARMADMLNPIGYELIPDWLQAVSNGFVVGLMYLLAIKLSIKFNRRSPLFATLIVFILTFAMRWDGIWMEYNTFYNYVWSSAFIMASLGFLFSGYSQKGKWYWWLMLPFCFISAAMHEASGVPLSISLCVMLMLTSFYKEAYLLRRLTLIAMIAGGLFPLTSPASYQRIGSMLQPEPVLTIILGSAIFVVILILVIVCLLIFRKQLLKSLVRSTWIVFVGIAILSSCFMLLSGFGGRTGWFAQLFAVIAIFQVADRLNIKIGRYAGLTVSMILSCLIIFHIWQVTAWQYRLSDETRSVISEYKKSTDGIVYFDYTSDRDLPWYLLRKNHGVPDDDDSYYRYRMRLHYGNGKQLVVLPVAFCPIPDSLSGFLIHGDFILTDKCPVETYGDTIVSMFPRKLTVCEGKEFIINSFRYKDRELYLLSLMDRDRGEK